MAISPHVKVRLSPYELACLEMISSRYGEHEATWAGHALRAAILGELRDTGREDAAQTYYQAQLDARATAAAAALAERLAVPQRATVRRRRAV